MNTLIGEVGQEVSWEVFSDDMQLEGCKVICTWGTATSIQSRCLGAKIVDGAIVLSFEPITGDDDRVILPAEYPVTIEGEGTFFFLDGPYRVINLHGTLIAFLPSLDPQG